MAEKLPRLFVDEMVLPTGVIADLPAASTELEIGTIRIVTDEGVGDNFALVMWDGTNWIDARTGSAVAA